MEDTILLEQRNAVANVADLDGSTSMEPDQLSEDLVQMTLKSLDDDKAEDIVSIPLKGKSEIADVMIVASGRSARHVMAIAEKLVDRLKSDAGILARIEGKETGDWVLIDASDVIIHLFRPEVREFYQLEKMWLDPAS